MVATGWYNKWATQQPSCLVVWIRNFAAGAQLDFSGLRQRSPAAKRMLRDQRHLGCFDTHPGDNPRQQAVDQKIRDADAKASLRGAGIEFELLLERMLQPLQRRTDRIHEIESTAWRFHAVRRPLKRFVAEGPPQGPEGMADCRGADPDPVGGAGDTPLGDQRIEDHQQVEIDVPQIHRRAEPQVTACVVPYLQRPITGGRKSLQLRCQSSAMLMRLGWGAGI